MTAVEIATVVGIGALVGLLPGLFGVGGGFLMVPLLHIGAGVPINIAVGSCACQTIGSVTTGMLHRRAAGELYYRLAWIMLPGTVAGQWAGIAMLNWTKTSTARLEYNGRELPLMEVTQLVCFLGIMLVLALVVALETYFAADGENESSRRGWLEDVPLPPHVPLPEIDGRRVSLPIATLLGIVVGFLNGGFGMGGAILLVPGLVFLIGLTTHRAIAVTLVSSALGGLFGVMIHAVSGNIDLRLVCWLLLGGTVGAELGSIVAQRLTGLKLRRWFAAVILASTGIILARLYHLANG